jgi:hypothetical protein
LGNAESEGHISVLMRHDQIVDGNSHRSDAAGER